VTLSLLAAAGIALCYGSATVFQSMGAQRTEASDGLDPGLFVRLLRSVPYLAGLGLDAAGFLLTIVALQTLPLFVVESFTAGSLAVTAVMAAVVLHLPLARQEWVAVATVCVGLAAVGLSAGPDQEVDLDAWQAWLPLVAALVLAAAAVAAARLRGRSAVLVLGATAGLGFGLVGIATRTIQEPITVVGLLTDPSAYGIAVAGFVALLALATALQRGAVTQATAAMVVAETLLPSAIGLGFLGDTIRPGFVAVAVIGLALAIGGSLMLSRLGDVEPAGPTGPKAGA